MKRFKYPTILMAIAILTSACAGEAVPTMNAADVQSTAVAAAFTVVAQTQAAVPTATLVPPTDTPTATPMPTDTPVPLPTQDVTLVPATPTAGSTSSASGDPCNRTLSTSLQGKPTILRIYNASKENVRVSLYLSETASHGECGYRSYDIKKNNDIVLSDLVQGCYSLLAWTIESKNEFKAFGSGCINNSDKWTFEIKEGSVKFVGP